MPMSDEVLASKEGHVLRVTLNRPGKHNALSRAVLARLGGIMATAADDSELKCVVLTGAGERYFAAGGDVRDLDAVRTRDETVVMASAARAALDVVRGFPLPVVAALNGDAIGGGAELAVACDMRVASANAKIGYIHGKLAISSAWGGGPDLVALVGPSRALRMMALCELISTPLALQWGLVDAVADKRPIDATVSDFIAPLLQQSTATLRAAKAQARAWRRGDSFDDRRALEQQHLVSTWTSAEHWSRVERLLQRK
jgi:enoyl-CoA hydratase